MLSDRDRLKGEGGSASKGTLVEKLFACEDDRTAYDVFNVGSGRPGSVRELAQLLARRLGRDTALEPNRRFRLGDYRHLVLDAGRLGALGFAPAVTLEDGLDRFVHWLRAAAPAPAPR